MVGWEGGAAASETLLCSGRRKTVVDVLEGHIHRFLFQSQKVGFLGTREVGQLSCKIPGTPYGPQGTEPEINPEHN